MSENRYLTETDRVEIAQAERDAALLVALVREHDEWNAAVIQGKVVLVDTFDALALQSARHEAAQLLESRMAAQALADPLACENPGQTATEVRDAE